MRFVILGRALGAVLVICAVCTASASALTWEINRNEVITPASYKAKGTVVFRGPSPEENKFTCSSFTEEGEIESGGVGKITGPKTTASGCTPESGKLCTSAIEVEALHLPWKTELVTVNGVPRNKIVNGGSGTPEWMIKCTGELGKTEDRCVGPENSMGVSNLGEGVKAAFDSEYTAGSCNIGNSHSLVLSGSEQIESPRGKLQVAMPEWRLDEKPIESSKSVSSKGTLTVSDSAAPATVECSVAGERKLEQFVVAQIVATFSGCKVKGEKPVCHSGTTVEQLGSPWRSVLSTSGGSTRELISELTGHGTPGFKINCYVPLVGYVTDECTGKTSASVSDVTGGVQETFDSKSEKLSCTGGTSTSGSIEGSVTLESPSGHTLAYTAP